MREAKGPCSPCSTTDSPFSVLPVLSPKAWFGPLIVSQHGDRFRPQDSQFLPPLLEENRFRFAFASLASRFRGFNGLTFNASRLPMPEARTPVNVAPELVGTDAGEAGTSAVSVET